MKVVFILCCSILHSVIADSQSFVTGDLKGVWQRGTPVVSSGIQRNFRFFNDSTFQFTVGDYDELSRIRCVGGRYLTDKNIIYLDIKYRKEIQGGNILVGADGSTNSEFVIDTAREITVTQAGSLTENFFSVKECSKNSDGILECIMIGANKYYRISNDPYMYQDK